MVERNWVGMYLHESNFGSLQGYIAHWASLTRAAVMAG